MNAKVSSVIEQRDSLDRLFRPRSVAVIGASSTPSKIGGLPIAFLLANGFQGEIYPINPKATEIQGLKAYPSIREVSGKVDLVIVAVPAAMVEQALDDAIAAQVSGIVLFSSGFAEVSDEGSQAQQALMARAEAAGVRVLGPNCLGFMNLKEKVFATFSPVVGQGVAPTGRIGLVSQSGAYGAYAFTLARQRGIGLNYWITTGNEGNVDFADCVAWLANDPDTDVILGYMEGCRDGRKLEAALAAARDAGKPVVITKVGRTAIGAQAAASHTAALAGEDAIFDAVFRQYGVYRANSIEEFFDVGYAVSVAGLPKGNKLGVFTVSGGAGVLMADAADEAGLVLPELGAEGQAKIRGLVPFAAPRNPVDITGQITNDVTLFETSLQIMLDNGDYQMMIAFLAAAGLGALGENIAGQIAAVRQRFPDRVFCAVSVFNDPVREILERNGCLAFQDPSRAIRALSALAGFAEFQARTVSARAEREPDPVTLDDCTYSEARSFEVLSRFGVPVPETHLVHSGEEAAVVAGHIDRPLVAKIASADITHKSDIGGVRLNLRGADQVARACDEILAAARQACPDARLDGVLLSPMESEGVECIVGVQRDPAFGPVVMLGLGGVLVEVLGDVSFRTAPLNRDMAMEMIDELRGKALLFGARGRPHADVDALVDLLMRVSEFAVAAGDSLESLDINPVLVRAKGEGVVALDGLLIGRR
ncbi:acetate--CoA ligase family protein [Alloalcanivorax mobilis]|uniref:acetate--CoA ligase family protein n=1 Tax=Alloalcanivorax mobilis TaxID=2019569 RepID=UPI000B5B0DB7|nr:acetate--CoA ligase family protein [Alloalcanivorax mobilis]ASK35667.1 6-carboxyhexanoate--CoA ligase [Alcanivorax sp. N3-2A]|tara:strand:- start:18438 stop:20558 length:2121 start_codon:yes stop_codon:yes gene_type:complete